jgi:L-alanine-DL-glutamate epimerase-like enolase superfamily enzyme
MKLSIQPLTLDLRTTFRIAHSAEDQRHNVIVRLTDGDLTGLGEAAAVRYHGETQTGILDYLSRLGSLGDDPFRLEEILNSLPPGSRAARAAVDVALHDLWARRLGQPLYRLLGLSPERTPPTCFTIAIDEPQIMAERARASGFPILKIKLGAGDDLAILSAIRRACPDVRLRVDANAGWSREQAAAILPRLAEFGLEFIEQPLPAGDIDGLKMLRSLKTGLPIFADEPVKSARDVAAHAGAVDGVVIKLMKTGGIREALRAIAVARAHDLQIMIGCMVETSLGVTAAAHLAPLCDHADLDGPLLIKEDPFNGIRYDGDALILPSTPGLGVVPI